MEIGERIKKRREELGMTMEELAFKVGYKTNAAISSLEVGRTQLKRSKVMDFCKALYVSPAWLCGWEDGSKDRLIDKISRLDERDRETVEVLVDTLLKNGVYKKDEAI